MSRSDVISIDKIKQETQKFHLNDCRFYYQNIEVNGVRLSGSDAARDTVRLIEEKLHVGSWKLEIPSGRVEWSRGFCELFGFDPELREGDYQDLIELIHPDNRRQAVALDQIGEATLPFGPEFRVIRPNGTVRWLKNRGDVLLNSAGTPERAVGVVIDLTREHESSRGFDSVLARYQALVAGIDGYVWIARQDGYVLEYSSSNLPGHPDVPHTTGFQWRDMIHPDDIGTTLAVWAEAVAQERSYKRTHRIRYKDGYQWRQGRAWPIRDASGLVREWLGVSFDLEKQIGKGCTKTQALLTGEQVRASRALLGWSIRELSERANVPAAALRRIEAHHADQEVPSDSIQRIRQTLENVGVEFLFPAFGKPTARLS